MKLSSRSVRDAVEPSQRLFLTRFTANPYRRIIRMVLRDTADVLRTMRVDKPRNDEQFFSKPIFNLHPRILL
jgi:hypothetical protein